MTKEYQEDGVLFLRSKNINPFRLDLNDVRYIPKGFHHKIRKSALKAGDVVVVRTGYPGTSCVIPNDLGETNCSDLVIVRPGKGLDSHFLCYYLNSSYGKGFIQGALVGAAQQHFNIGVARKLPVPHPPITEQKEIVSVLSAYDELIELNNRRIALLEQTAEQLYKEWFVRLRFPGYAQTKVRKGVPEGWKVKNIRSLVDFYIGGGWGAETSDATHNMPAYVIRGTDIPNLRKGDLNKGIYRYHKPSNLKKRLLKPCDIVFEVSGGSKGQPLGRNVLLSEKLISGFENKVMCASFCKLIRPNKEIVSPYLLAGFLELYHNTGVVGTFQVQSTGISNYQFEAFLDAQTLLVPSKNIQQMFESKVKPIRDQIYLLGDHNQTLRRTRDLLLPRLISGQLSVAEAEIALNA